MVQSLNKLENWFFVTVNKIGKFFEDLIKEKRARTNIY